MRHWPAIALAFVSGAALAVQGRINAGFGLEIDDGLFAALVSCTIGMALMAVIVLAFPSRRRLMRNVLPAIRERRLRWWFLLSGLGGSFFVASQAVGVPVLGIALFSMTVTAAQVTSSLGVDRLGIGPMGRTSVTPRRVVAALLGLGAVMVATLGRSSVEATVPIVAILMVMVVGALMAPQQAINARVARETQSLSVPTLLNFTASTVGLVVAVLIAQRGIPEQLSDGVPAWLLLGGPLGLIYIGTATAVVRVVGVLLFFLTAVSGQLAASLIIDIMLPVPGTVISGGVVAALVISMVAVAVGALRR